jgi:hypothetical protein
MMPPSRIAPMPDSSYFERLLHLHFDSVNDDPPSRAKSYWDAVIYGAAMLFLLGLFGVFGDL